MKQAGLLVLSLLFGSSFAFAAAVKADREAAKGCIPSVSVEQARDYMKEFNITVSKNAKSEEIRALGTGLKQILELNGGSPLQEAVSPNRDGFEFRFKDGNGNSFQRGWGVQITRNGAKKYGSNVAQLVHELGHLVGNQGGYREYRNYMGGAKKYCKVSTYSDDKPNEQFAEVFAAFVTKPELLTGSNNCATAYKFFSRVFFKDGEKAERCK